MIDSSQTKRTVTIRGVVVPVDWDQSHGVVRVSIITNDENVYKVVPTDKSKILNQMVHHTVEATGMVDGTEGEIARITITYLRDLGPCTEVSDEFVDFGSVPRNQSNALNAPGRNSGTPRNVIRK